MNEPTPAQVAAPRRLSLVRHVDVSGVSGVGVVAHGVRFADGTTVIRWCSGTASTVVWDSVEDALAVHGHGGATELRWLDGDDDVPDLASGIERQIDAEP